MTVALCPLFFDFAIIVPAINTLRLFLPTYWLFAAAKSPLAFGIAAPTALLLFGIFFIIAHKHSKIKETL